MEKDFLKKPYEISIWEDKLVKEYIDVEGESDLQPVQYYKEIKLATIGSNTMVTPTRAFNPILTKNINGSTTLQFSLYNNYFDDEAGEYVANPFIKYLVNERKIKLYYKDENEDEDWKDLIIKNVQEDSKNNIYTYTAKDLFINELSKTGFSVELDTELRNNQGTIHELANTIFKNTDWEVIKRGDGTDTFQQFLEEPLYKIPIKENIIGYDMQNPTKRILIEPTKVNGKETSIYVFYSIINEKNPYFQFLYVPSDEGYDLDGNQEYLFDDNYNISNSPNYAIEDVEYSNEGMPSFAKYTVNEVTNKFRGKRLVRKNKTEFDPSLKRIVNVYKDSVGDIVYGYKKHTVLDTKLTKNLINNGEYFTTDDGWIPDKNVKISSRFTYPKVGEGTTLNQPFYPVLTTTFDSTGAKLLNKGIETNRSTVGNIAKGQKYVFTIRQGRRNFGSTIASQIDKTSGLRAVVAEYTVEEDTYKIESDKIIFNFNQNFNTSNSGEIEIEINEEGVPINLFKQQYIIAEAQHSYSYEDLLKKKIGIFLYSKDTDINGLSNKPDYLIESVELFPYYEDTVSKPTEKKPFISYKDLSYFVPVVDTYYYYKSDLNIVKNEDEIVYIYKGEKPSPDYEIVYSESFEKIRSLTAKESNVFNLSQTLCEIFECWIKYNIKHEENGQIELILEWDEEAECYTYRQNKSVSFHEFTGKDNHRGFRYGINLESITRSLDSDTIVTKLIVKPNSNEFATNGFCTIARAEENPTKQNFLLNFRYYINQGLLDFSEVSNDLYDTGNNYLGYITHLREINKNLSIKIDEFSQLSTSRVNEEALNQSYSLIITEAEDEKLNLKNQLYNHTGYTYEQINNNNPAGAKDKLKDEVTKEMVTSIKRLDDVLSKTNLLKAQSDFRLEQLTSSIKNAQEDLDNLKEQNIKQDKAFYKKYSRFIQEGSWTSNDYVDDNLYYLDSESVLNTSVMPQVTYSIKVLELSQVPGYENYIFSVGDKTYIEDVEFFGWVYHSDGAKTPYKEDIIISEITYHLDSPEKNTVVAQNYKTQFEDLFQRISAATQSIQYSQGEFRRAADIIQSDNSISASTLQNSFTNNAIILANSRDQSVVWDETGIKVTNLRRPNEIVRLVSGGIFISKTGGSNWTAAITGSGINVGQLTSGSINTSKIQIMSGSFPTFRWDEKGLTAYSFTLDSNNKPQYFDFTKFIRFDQYGLYGIDSSIEGIEDFNPTSLNDVLDNSNFSLTWDGFRLKGTREGEEGGYFSITSEKDLEIYREADKLALHLGLLREGHYGLELFDEFGNTSLITTDEGSLQSGNYISGHTGWKIAPDGAVEFENADIRGTLRSTVFSYDEVNAQGGSLIIAKSSVLDHELEIKPTDTEVSFTTRDIHGGVFSVGDTIRILTHITPEVKVSLWLKITAADFKTYNAEILKSESDSLISYTLPAGTPLVNYGKKDEGYLLLRADDKVNGPYLDVVKNIETDITKSTSRQMMVRLGDLSGIGGDQFGVSPSGYGLYAENAFLTGTLALPYAGMTDYQKLDEGGNNQDSIRLWAGGTYNDLINDNDDELKFKVYESGKMVLGSGGTPAFTFKPDTNEVVLGGATKISFTSIEDAPPVYEVLINGNDIQKGETETTLTVQVLQNGIDITELLSDEDFEWIINGVNFEESINNGGLNQSSSGKTQTISADKIEGSALIVCIFTYN